MFSIAYGKCVLMARKKGYAEITERIGVIYARYSSHNQKEESIEQQVEECMAFAALNHIKIIQVYSDKTIPMSAKEEEAKNCYV